MGKTTEIAADVQAVGTALVGGRQAVSEALDRAVELTEQAAAHGWDGVAASMQGARDALEVALASLGTADDTTGDVLAAINGITAQTSQPEVAEHLGRAANLLDRVRTAVDAANSGIGDARTAAEQAGSPGELMSMLQSVADDIDTTTRGLAAVKGAVESEQGQAASWGN